MTQQQRITKCPGKSFRRLSGKSSGTTNVRIFRKVNAVSLDLFSSRVIPLLPLLRLLCAIGIDFYSANMLRANSSSALNATPSPTQDRAEQFTGKA